MVSNHGGTMLGAHLSRRCGLFQHATAAHHDLVARDEQPRQAPARAAYYPLIVPCPAPLRRDTSALGQAFAKRKWPWACGL